jgi:prepilin-type N-terminal cleavage/methylation domain-containing protein
MKTRRNQKGFTLIEVLFAVMLIGLVVAAIAVSSGAATMVNGVGIDLSTAEFLIGEIRERTATATFDEILAYDGNTYNPPIEINGTVMPEFSGFAQQIVIEYVNSDNFSQVAASPPTDFIRITVTITKNSRPISSSSWIRARL